MLSKARSALVAAVLGVLLGPVTARAQQYTFTRIAQTDTAFGSPASLNDAGWVAFQTDLGPSLPGIVVGKGGPLITVADTSGIFRFFGLPSIDGNRRVSFFAFTKDNRGGIFAGPNGERTLLDDSGPVSGFAGDPHSSGAGPFTVMHAFLKDGGQAIFLSKHGAPATPVVDTSSTFTDFDIDPRVNAFGQVVFQGDLAAGGSGIFVANGGNKGGGAVTPIADDSGAFKSFAGFPSINDRGDVAFGAALKTGPNPFFNDGIFVVRGGQLQTLVDSNGAFQIGISFGRPTLNDNGQVAFLASLKSGEFGLFVGPDPVADRVIALNDALDGSTVTGLSVFGDYFNNAGQLAFTANLADGRTVIMRADPNHTAPTVTAGVSLERLAASREHPAREKAGNVGQAFTKMIVRKEGEE
jgi:hypothetical protein